jgi:hypothetical protein
MPNRSQDIGNATLFNRHLRTPGVISDVQEKGKALLGSAESGSDALTRRIREGGG